MTIIDRSWSAGRRDRFTSKPLAVARFAAQRGLLVPVVRTVVRVRAHGRDRIGDLSGPFILVANHSSHLDAPLLFSALPATLTRHLATGAAADYFFTGRWRRALTILFFNGFAVHRAGTTSAERGTCRRLVRDGVPVMVFPEGTRSRSGEMAPFRVGTAGLSIAYDVPCLPVAIRGANRAMPPGRAWPVAGRPPVDVVIGAPMRATPGETPEQFTVRLARAVRDLNVGSPTPTEISTTATTTSREAA